MRVVKAVSEDFARVLPLRLEMTQECTGYLGETLSREGWMRIHAETCFSMAEGLDTWFLAQEGAQTVGYAHMTFGTPLVGRTKVAVLQTIYVTKEHRSPALFGEFHEKCIAEAGSRGYDLIQGMVLEGNPVRALWDRVGARPVATVMELAHGWGLAADEAGREEPGGGVQGEPGGQG